MAALAPVDPVQAAPVGDFELVYDGGKIAGVKCKYKSVINEAGAVAGAYLGTFGDSTIIGSAVELTATVVPAEAATGVTGKTITWTFSASLNGNTVNAQTFQVIENPASSPVAVPGTVVLTNAGAATTVVWTRTAGNFTASQYWVALASPTVADQNGNLLENGVGLSTYFQT